KRLGQAPKPSWPAWPLLPLFARALPSPSAPTRRGPYRRSCPRRKARRSEVDRDALLHPIAVARGTEFFGIAAQIRRRRRGVGPIRRLAEACGALGGSLGHHADMGRLAARRNSL